MKTKGPPIFLFVIALIIVGFVGYWNFSRNDGSSIVEMFNKLPVLWDPDTAATTTTVSASQESTTDVNEENDTTPPLADNSNDSSEATKDTNESQSPEEVDAAKAFEALSDINVDRNLLTVNMTLPADFIGETNQDEIDKSVASDPGFLAGTYNSDGSVTYVMSYLKYMELLDETKKSIDEGLKDMAGSDDYPLIQEITHNADFSEYTIRYKGKEVSFVDSFSVLTCYMYSGFYSIFSGHKYDNVHVVFVNSETGAVISEANSADMGKE